MRNPCAAAAGGAGRRRRRTRARYPRSALTDDWHRQGTNKARNFGLLSEGQNPGAAPDATGPVNVFRLLAVDRFHRCPVLFAPRRGNAERVAPWAATRTATARRRSAAGGRSARRSDAMKMCAGGCDPCARCCSMAFPRTPSPHPHHLLRLPAALCWRWVVLRPLL